MASKLRDIKYVPGTYVRKRPDADTLAENYVHKWEKDFSKIKEKPPVICFSRKIGSGALEIADILASKIGYNVFDREFLEHITDYKKMNQKATAIFDKIYPGELTKNLFAIFEEKGFLETEYTRILFSSIISVSGLEPSIFVGRGTHLVLPKDRVLSVRFICSSEYRIKRLARILGADEEDVETQLKQIDKEQKNFFAKVYNKKEASPYEFDLVINRDYIKETQWAAEIVAQAFKIKFGKGD